MIDAELDEGQDSDDWREAEEELREVEREAKKEEKAIQARIDELVAANARYEMVFGHTNPNRGPKTIPVEEIVRAYPANRLGFLERTGVYLSRWWE